MSKRKTATAVQMESNMPAPTEGPTGTFSIWKPNDTEFRLDTEFAAIAAALNVPHESVVWSLTEGIVNNDIDGHVLSGHA